MPLTSTSAARARTIAWTAAHTVARTAPPSSPSFAERVRKETGTALSALTIDTLQVNIGLRCNLACHHCHVESSPKRREEMSRSTMNDVLAAAKRAGATTIDVTGGAPELHPHFRSFVRAATEAGLHVLVRSNLTVLRLPGHEDLPRFFAALGLHVVASLPCYLEETVQRQRGRHVYQESIQALQHLNELGYGTDRRLQLDLIFNPGGPSLPPDQADLEKTYRSELERRHGVHFDRLFTIANMPIGRFRRDLEQAGRAASYDRLLESSFNPSTVSGLMCRHQAHVGWDGTLYDCDFNFALGLPARAGAGHVRDFDPTDFLARRIRTRTHCFGCTAGSGSSCKGALT